MASIPVSDPSVNRGPEFNRVVAPFIGLSTAAVVLRIWSRVIGSQGRKFWWDDWTAIICYILGLVLSIVGIVWTKYGLGRHEADIPISDAYFGLKLAWISYYLFTTGVGFIKLSALLFYQRVLAVSETFKKILWATQGLVYIWLITFLCTIIFNCTPVKKFYMPEVPGHCINLYAWYMACGVFDVVLDIIVLVLPIPILWRLHMGLARKFSITIAFLCGYLALIPSLGRLVSTAQRGEQIATDFTYEALTDLQWSYIEIPIGVISICIPSWFTLYKRWSQHGFTSLFTTRVLTKPSQNSRSGGSSKESGSHTMSNSSITKTQSYKVERWSGSGSSMQHERNPSIFSVV